MFSGGGFGVGLTVADLAPPSPEVGPPVTAVPSLGELLPVHARTAAEKAAELQRVQRLKAELAAYELHLVAGFAADRPAALDRPRARTFAEELGWTARDTDPAAVAAVEAAVLPEAAGLSVRRLKERLRR